MTTFYLICWPQSRKYLILDFIKLVLCPLPGVQIHIQLLYLHFDSSSAPINLFCSLATPSSQKLITRAKIKWRKISYLSYSIEVISLRSLNFSKSAWGDQSRLLRGRILWEKTLILISRAANNHFGRIKTEKNGKRCWNLLRRSIFGYFFRRQNSKNCCSSTQTR